MGGAVTHPEPIYLAERLNQWMPAQGFTTERLAKRLGVSQRQVTRWRDGAGVSLKNARALAELMGCDASDFYETGTFGEGLRLEHIEKRLDRIEGSLQLPPLQPPETGLREIETALTSERL